MARPEVTGRALAKEPKKRPRKSPERGKTVPRFLNVYGIPRSTWNRMREKGTAPKVVQPAGKGGKGIITPEAEADWLASSTEAAWLKEQPETAAARTE